MWAASHAIANGLPVLCSNRCGHEAPAGGSGDGTDFWGHSFICGPQGEFLAEAPAGTGLEIFATLSAALIYYLNFKYGYSIQAPRADRALHEVRERDYFFIASFSGDSSTGA